MTSYAKRISSGMWAVSFCGLALFIPFSISGANISIMIGFVASIVAVVSDADTRARYRRAVSDPMFGASILLAVSAIPAVILSENTSRALRDWKSYWLMLVYFLVAYNLLSDRLRRAVYWILLTSASLSCVVSFVQYLGGIDVLFIRIEPETYRPGSTLYNMTFAGILYQLIALNFAMILIAPRVARNITAVSAGLAVQLTALLLTLTRGAWMALFAGLCAVPILLRRRMFALIALGLVFAAAVFALSNEQLRQRALTIVDNIRNPTDKNISTRLTLWDISWDIFTKHPLLGVGMGDYSIEADKLLRERRVTTTVDSHNIYLQILATRGVVGFVPFVLYWVVLLRTLVTARRRGGEDDPFAHHFITGTIAATVAVLVGALSENNIDDSEVFIAFMFLVGVSRSFAVSRDCGGGA